MYIRPPTLYWTEVMVYVKKWHSVIGLTAGPKLFDKAHFFFPWKKLDKQTNIEEQGVFHQLTFMCFMCVYA